MYSKKSLFLFVLAYGCYIISFFAQTTSLHSLILEHAKKSSCYPDESDNLVVNVKKTDDRGNGYFSVEYAIAGCGCECKNSVGAYKKSSGEYIILNNEWGQCNYRNGVGANVPFEQFMPDSFGLQTFYKDSIGKLNDKYPALFYLKAEIPQKGTETIFELNLIPMGMKIFDKEGFSYKIQEHESVLDMDMLGDYGRMAKELKDQNTLKYLRNGQYNKISAEDKKTIDQFMKDNQSQSGEMARMKSYDEIKKMYQYLYYVYTWYKKLEYTILVMSWDAEKGKFYIKEKKGKPKSQTFIEFLDYENFWTVMC